MIRKVGILGSLAALLLLVASVPVAATPSIGEAAAEYALALETSAEDNQEFEATNVPTAANITCAISPYDPEDGSFRSAGGGSPQAIVENVTVKAQDYADFQVACAGADTNRFSVTAEYSFEVQSQDGTWSTIPDTENVCGALSSPGGSIRAQEASFSVPGPSTCESKEFYSENHPSLGRSHRLFVSLTSDDLTTGAVNDGPSIQGVSKPWPSLCVSGGSCALSTEP